MSLALSGATVAINQLLDGQGIFVGLGLSALSQTYTWKLPTNTVDKFGELEGENRLEETIFLKYRLQKIWDNDQSRRPEIADWIISDWGGIRSNSIRTKFEHFSNANSETPVLSFRGVSSYSKILSVRNADQFAVFDARVVVALNALQLLAETRDGLAFPYIAGRNNVTGHQGKGRGFSASKEFSVRNLVDKHGWQRVPRDLAYGTYLNLVRTCVSDSKRSASLPEIEMTLFSQAERLAQLATQREMLA